VLGALVVHVRFRVRTSRKVFVVVAWLQRVMGKQVVCTKCAASALLGWGSNTTEKPRGAVATSDGIRETATLRGASASQAMLSKRASRQRGPRHPPSNPGRCTSLGAERLDGIEARGPTSGIEAECDTDDRAEAEGDERNADQIDASPVIWNRYAARSGPAMPMLSSRDRHCAKRPLGTHLPKPPPMGRRESEAGLA